MWPMISTPNGQFRSQRPQAMHPRRGAAGACNVRAPSPVSRAVPGSGCSICSHRRCRFPPNTGRSARSTCSALPTRICPARPAPPCSRVPRPWPNTSPVPLRSRRGCGSRPLRPLRRGASGRIRGIVPGLSGVRRASWRRSAGRLRRRPSSRRWRSLRVRRIRRAVAVRGRCCAAPARNSRPPRAYPRRRSAAAGRNRGSPRTSARR